MTSACWSGNAMGWHTTACHGMHGKERPWWNGNGGGEGTDMGKTSHPNAEDRIIYLHLIYLGFPHGQFSTGAAIGLGVPYSSRKKYPIQSHRIELNPIVFNET